MYTVLVRTIKSHMLKKSMFVESQQVYTLHK